MAKKNWDILRRQAATDTLRNRDVYESQQLDRTKVGKSSRFSHGISLQSLLDLLRL